MLLIWQREKRGKSRGNIEKNNKEINEKQKKKNDLKKNLQMVKELIK